MQKAQGTPPLPPNQKADSTLKKYGMNAMDSRKIGDMLRSQELTVNMHFAALIGYSRTGEKKPSLFKQQRGGGGRRSRRRLPRLQLCVLPAAALYLRSGRSI